jgi:hypothetical protein
MCKLAVLTNMSKIKKPKKAIETIAKHLTKHEQDGFGYTIQGSNGTFGERTLEPSNFQATWGREMLSFPFLEVCSNRFGEYSTPFGSGIFHGRTSTNDKSLLNTHPINKHDWSLIHNGVVSNNGPKYKMDTTNDTEHLVHYLANGGLDTLAKHLSGYYAAAAISPDGALHVFRDNRATLYFAEIAELETYIICTTRELISSICKDLSWTVSNSGAIKDNHYLVFRDGTLESYREFEPIGATEYENRYAHLSLGEIQDWSERKEAVSYSYNDFTDDENLFFDEIHSMDHTYTILDYRGNRIPLKGFLSLEPAEQLSCTVIRPDGTIVDSDDYNTEKLYQGNIA